MPTCIVVTDEPDLPGQAEGFELAFDCLNAAPQVDCDPEGAKIPSVDQEFEDPLTPICWRALGLNRIRAVFSGGQSINEFGRSMRFGWHRIQQHVYSTHQSFALYGLRYTAT
jgi:hypothetical protein